MLEIIEKDKMPDDVGFAREMTKLHVDTIKKINAISEKYHANPFNAIKTFGTAIFQNGADLQAKFTAEYGDDDDDKENEGGKT